MLRKEFDALRPAHVPDGPTHAARVRAAIDTGADLPSPVDALLAAMTAYTIMVVSAGLGQPSSTRLLGERLAPRPTASSAPRGAAVRGVEVVELRDVRPGSDQPPADRLPERPAGRADRAGDRRRSP